MTNIDKEQSIHEIILEDYDHIGSADDTYGTTVIVDGKELFYDGQYTYNCLEEILNEFGIKANVIVRQEDDIE